MKKFKLKQGYKPYELIIHKLESRTPSRYGSPKVRAKYYKNPLSYAVDSDLSNGWSYPSFEPLESDR